jgi:hypothetical protein
MAVPWLKVLDVVLGVTDLARSRKMGSRPPADELTAAGPAGRALGQIETRLAGVVVAALKEAFDRDSRRLDLEREQMEAERARAERALRLELLRQSGERELARLRLLTGVAVASWIGTLFFSGRLIAGGVAPRVLLGCGWVLLLAAVATSFVAQSRVGDELDRVDAASGAGRLSAGLGAALAPWLVVAGLALVGIAVLTT